MDISYQRNLRKSYMCIETTEDVIEEHELMILQKYKVPQLLQTQVVIQDGKVQYWFEITGKQQLADYLGGKPIGVQMLKKILFSLEGACEKMPEFLLQEDRICLMQEMLYVDLKDEMVYFTYLPFWKSSFPESFERWMEDVLREIDHQEKECVELAYHIYEGSRKENVSIYDLLEEVRKGEVIAFQQDFIEEKVEKTEESSLKSWKREYMPQELNTQPEERKWKKILSTKIEELQSEVKEYVKSKVPKLFPRPLTSSKKEKTEKSQKVYHTELLCKQQQGIEGKLIYQGENECANLVIDSVEFFIGRNSDEVDGSIATEGISRIHARIIQKEGAYYIEDLNSTNGTYLNGEFLEYHRSAKLERNDKVRFGVEEYVFY